MINTETDDAVRRIGRNKFWQRFFNVVAGLGLAALLTLGILALWDNSKQNAALDEFGTALKRVCVETPNQDLSASAEADCARAESNEAPRAVEQVLGPDQLEIQDPEVNDPEIQEAEIQERERQERERQEAESPDGEVDDLDPDDPEVQDEEDQEPEIQDPETQDDEVPIDSFSFEWMGITFVCTDADKDQHYECVTT